MKIVSVFDAKAHFGSILDRVAEGEEVAITRHHKPVAGIVPEGGRSQASIRDAVAGLRALRERISARKRFRPLTDAAIRAAISEGRR